MSSRFQSAIPTSRSEKKKTVSWHLHIFSSWLFPFGASPVGCCLLVPDLALGAKKRLNFFHKSVCTVVLHSSKVNNLKFFEYIRPLTSLGLSQHFLFAFPFSLFFFLLLPKFKIQLKYHLHKEAAHLMFMPRPWEHLCYSTHITTPV